MFQSSRFQSSQIRSCQTLFFGNSYQRECPPPRMTEKVENARSTLSSENDCSQTMSGCSSSMEAGVVRPKAPNLRDQQAFRKFCNLTDRMRIASVRHFSARTLTKSIFLCAGNVVDLGCIGLNHGISWWLHQVRHCRVVLQSR